MASQPDAAPVVAKEPKGFLAALVSEPDEAPTPQELESFRAFVKKPVPVPEDPGALVPRQSAAPFEPPPPALEGVGKLLQDWEKVALMDDREKAALYKKKKPDFPVEPEVFEPFEPPEPFTLLEPPAKPVAEPEPIAEQEPVAAVAIEPKPVATAVEPVATAVEPAATAVDAGPRAIKSVHVTHDTVTITFYS